MGRFDIDYATRTPRGGPAGVRANLDVSTGAEAIGGAIQRLGGELLDIDIAIQQSQQAMELSTFQRKDEELKAAALQTLQSPGFDINDEDAIVKLKEKTDADRTSQTSKRGKVNFLYSQHLNKTSPQFDKKFFDEIRGIKAGNAKDDFNLNSESFLGKGDLVNYQQLVNRAFETGVITRTEQKYRSENALIDSVFAQSRTMIAEGNYIEATAQLGALEGLSPTQLEYRNKLSEQAQEGLEKGQDSIQQEMWKDLRAGNFEELQQKVDASLLDVKDKKWWTNLAMTSEQALAQTDPKKQAEVMDSIIFEPQTVDPKAIRNHAGLGIHGGLSAEKIEEYEEKYNLMMDKNSALNTPLAKTFFNELKDAQNDRGFSIDKEKNNVIYGQSLDSLTDYFVNYRKKNDKDPSLKETQEYYDNLTSGYRSPERPFTDAKIQKTLGELQSGGSVSIFGTVLPFSRSEDAVNHALRNLGPNWQKIAPEAGRIIKSKWPGADIEQKEITVREQPEIGEIKQAPDGGFNEYKPDGPDDKFPWKPIE